MFRNDGEFLWKPGRIYIPGNWFTGMTVGTTVTAVGEGWVSTDTGVAISSEISTFGISAPLIGAAGDMWSTTVTSAMMYNVDVTKNINFRVHWTTASTTSADDMAWIVTYKALNENTTITAASTALDKTIASDLATGTAYQWQITDWGWIKPNTLSEDQECMVQGPNKMRQEAWKQGGTWRNHQ